MDTRRGQVCAFMVRVWGYYLWGTRRGMLGTLPCKDHWIRERAF